MSKNRNGSGIRTSSYLKSHKFLRTNNQSGLQSFQSQIQNIGNPTSSSKNFNQGRKLSINQMKTLGNPEELKDPGVSTEKSNNYTSFHTSKPTSYRQSYVGVSNTSGSGVTYNHYTNMNNYSSLTNSSSKPVGGVVGKEGQPLNALKLQTKRNPRDPKAVKTIKVSQNRSSSMSQSKSISHRKDQRSSDNKMTKFHNVQLLKQELNDVDMEDEEPRAIDSKHLFDNIHNQPNEDMDIDEDNDK